MRSAMAPPARLLLPFRASRFPDLLSLPLAVDAHTRKRQPPAETSGGPRVPPLSPVRKPPCWSYSLAFLVAAAALALAGCMAA